MLTRDPKFKYMSVIAVFEGNDAAGKGGSIRRITGALDARYYQVIPIAAPSEKSVPALSVAFLAASSPERPGDHL